MHNHLVRAARAALRQPVISTAFQGALRRVARPGVTVFMLHRFAKGSARWDRQSTEALRAGLEMMRSADITFESIGGVLGRLAAGERITRPAAVFTVDDGYADFVELAAPVFTEMRCPVTVFLTTDVVSGRLWYWWDEVEWILWSAKPGGYKVELQGQEIVLDLGSPVARVRSLEHLTAAAKMVPDAERHAFIANLGRRLLVEPPARAPSAYRTVSWADARSVEGEFVRFGPHSRTHPILSRLDDASAHEEITSSWEAVRRECVFPEPVFCYPNGTPESFGEREERIVREAGMLGAVMYARASLRPSPPEALAHRYHVPRVEFPLDIHSALVTAAGMARLPAATVPERTLEHANSSVAVSGARTEERGLIAVEVSDVSVGRHYYGVLRGLMELAEQDEISLSFRPRRDWHFPHEPNAFVASFRAPGQSPIAVCYDMMDWPELAAPSALELCDVYVKRSMHPGGYPEIPCALRHKMLPWGFSLPATIESISHSLEFYARRYLDARSADEVQNRRRDLAKNLAFKFLRRRHSGYAIEPDALPVPDYERLGNAPRVFLQTRLWDPRSTDSRHYRTTEQLNSLRVQLVRALRAALGDRFVGGVIPSDLSRAICPELLTDLGADFRSYFRTMGECLVAVTEAGIHGSNGARLPELLGAGRCVVSERLVYAPLVAPQHGRHILYYDSVEECVEHCRALLVDPQRAVSVARAAMDFYSAEVAPSAMARRFLEVSGIRPKGTGQEVRVSADYTASSTSR